MVSGFVSVVVVVVEGSNHRNYSTGLPLVDYENNILWSLCVWQRPVSVSIVLVQVSNRSRRTDRVGHRTISMRHSLCSPAVHWTWPLPTFFVARSRSIDVGDESLIWICLLVASVLSNVHSFPELELTTKTTMWRNSFVRRKCRMASNVAVRESDE